LLLTGLASLTFFSLAVEVPVVHLVALAAVPVGIYM